jgi:hypothetical protein
MNIGLILSNVMGIEYCSKKYWCKSGRKHLTNWSLKCRQMLKDFEANGDNIKGCHCTWEFFHLRLSKNLA